MIPSNIRELLEQELEDIEDAIGLASDPERPAFALLPEFEAQKRLVEKLLRKLE